MNIRDEVYGEQTIQDKTLIRLITSPPIQRLKGINQHGIPEQYFSCRRVTRYDHSVGVMLLLRKLGASNEAQIAGLLHDVSHTAFSHITDYVFGRNRKEDFHEKIKEHMFEQLGLNEIIEQEGITKKVLEPEQYPLLDSPAPKLCADRVDYALRDHGKFRNDGSPQRLVRELFAEDGEIVFKSASSAMEFAMNYHECQVGLWAHHDTAYKYYLFSRAIKLMLLEGELEKEELLLGKDENVLAKMEKTENSDVKIIMSALNTLEYTRNTDSPHVVFKKKFRWVDPAYKDRGRLRRVTEEFPEYAEMLDQARKDNQTKIELTNTNVVRILEENGILPL